MNNFAFIVSPITIKHFRQIWPASKFLPEFLIKPLLGAMPPVKSFRVKIKSLKDKETTGVIIVCPLPHKAIAAGVNEPVLEKIIAAGRLAKDLGAKIIGLGGLASLIQDKHHKISKALKIPATNGVALTAWSSYEAIFRTCRIKKISLKKSTLAVIGADNPLGSLCARRCADEVKDIITQDLSKAVKVADIIINASPAQEVVFENNDIKPNAIVCDISPNYALLNRISGRKDLTLIEGGLVKVPFALKYVINTGFPRDIICSQLAETALLALENRFVNYSSGENINLDKTEEIADLAAKHGFEVWVPQAPTF